MGKNLKRQNEAMPGTPSGVSRPGGKPPMSIGGKRHKQMSLVPFLRTPAQVEETPALQPKSGKAEITSTGLHKLGQLNLRTHQKQQQNVSTVAPTQGRPTPTAEPCWQRSSPGNDDEFVISMSQTYERTQPEPISDYGASECDDVELSLKRTQTYNAPGPTQPYGQQQHPQPQPSHHHDHVFAAAAAAALNPAIPAFATSTATEAWEASVAEASALVSEPSLSAALLAPAHVLEGQGSNQPGSMLRAAVEAAVREAAAPGGLNLNPLALLQRVNAPVPSLSSGPAQTPDLGGCGSGAACTTATEDVADDGTTPPLQIGVPLFPIFNQGKVRRRPIHLIRHGESEYNLACRRRGGFGDPNDIFDARLTPNGEKQARALRPQLLDLMQQHGDPLFIVSPLSRAIETFLLMLPDPERLSISPQTPPPLQSLPSASKAAGPHVAGVSGRESRQGGRASSAAGVSPACGETRLASKPLNVVICPHLTEFLMTTGDVGRPRSVLMDNYPQISEQLRKGLDKERWWYENTAKGPNCALNKTLSCTEPDKVAKARVDRFRAFIFSQPNRPIVVVGHAQFFKTLTHDSHYMGNCQVTTWQP